MKINRGKGIEIAQSLVFANGIEEDLVLMDKINVIKVTTDNTDFNKVIEGLFEFISEDTICVGGEMIPIEYIEEIELIN